VKIIRPPSKAILDAATGLLTLIWDKFFNDVQNTLNNLTLNAWFTMDAATSKVVTDPRVTAASNILLSPTNAAAVAVPLYISARTAGVSFTVHTGGGAASGTETYAYTVLG
jgi:hypothetical protein